MVKKGDWTIVYAQSTKNAVELMGSKSGGNLAKSSVDNLVIMQHGAGGDAGFSILAVNGTDGKGMGVKTLEYYNSSPEKLEKSNPVIYAEIEATKELGSYLQNDATVLNTACGGANEAGFVEEYSNLITTNIKDNKVKVILSGDDTQYIPAGETNDAIIRPSFHAPLISEEKFNQGASVFYNSNDAMSTSNNVLIKETNPQNENIITTQKQTTQASGTSNPSPKPKKK